MKNAIILHGSTDKEEYYSTKHPSMSNSHWIPWLQKRLLVADIPTATPEVPQCYELDYEMWRREFERYDITPETILVGHSCGGGFLVRWLSENIERKVGKVILVAPWINPLKEEKGTMFDFEMDVTLVSRTQGITLFSSDDDMASVQISIKYILEAIAGITLVEFHKYGHFSIGDMGTDAFPELLDHVLL